MNVSRLLERGFWVGPLLTSAGVAALILAPETRHCVTDYDLTVCQVGRLATFTTGSVLLIVFGVIVFAVAEVIAARQRHRDLLPTEDTR